MAKRKRQLAPLFFLIAGIAAFVAALNFILGSPLAKWIAGASVYDEPLVWAVVLMLVLAIVPMVVLVYLGEDHDREEP